ncbi:MAG: DsrE family protein [Nitrospirae bacterium]|nr:DsrE family protein [Nitrospirota bacterium]
MKLGILVNTDKHLDHIIGMVKAALGRGHEITIFVMDTGTKLLSNPAFSELSLRHGVLMSFCDLSAQKEGVKKEGLPDKILSGSQYNNAVMVHDSDKVLVF